MSDKGVLRFSPAQARSQAGAPVRSKANLAKAILVPSWERARDLSCAALLAGEMCLVVTGLPGTGKTLLVDTVARALRSTGWNIVTLAGRLPSETELAQLTGSAAILIDDADRLSATELRTLNRLRQCSVLLAGAVGFEKRCPADSRVTLAPLPPDEVVTYVDLWLEQAELSPDLVSEAAIAHLGDVSAGIPRVLSVLLADSLKGARADGSDQIEEHHIDHAAWRHVEHTAARRLYRATSTPSSTPSSNGEPKSAKPAPARPEADLERRLSQAPLADPSAVDQRMPLVSSRALGFAAVALAVGLLTAAGVLTSTRWLPWAVSTYNRLVSGQDAPREFIAAQALPEPVAAATAAPAMAPAKAAEVERLPPASIMPLAMPAPAQLPPDPVPTAVPASPPPSLETADVHPAPSAPPDTAPAGTALVAAPLPPSAAAETPSPLVVRLLYQRGQQMIDLNDFSAARLLFGRAAESGSVKAMVALGRSYDPYVIGSLASVAGVDPAQAAQWYRKAAALGSSDATILLQQLERSPRE